MGKILEYTLVGTAKVAWPIFQAANRLMPNGKVAKPAWLHNPVLKSKERVMPALGLPRTTDSLCPDCVKEARARIISGEEDLSILRNGNHPAVIKAHIIERDGKVWMTKDCPKHGHYEDILSIDVEFFKKIETLYPGSDYPVCETSLRNHGPSTVKYGRGSVLNVDLTNRCNMMCEPCFTDANQVGFVHELTLKDVKEILNAAASIKPKRQLSVQFSGGEPTLSPHFIDSIRYAKEIGFFSIQAATNGIRFAESPEFAKEAYDAGLRIAYLQFDGVGNENNKHRKIANLFDVKLRAIENLYNAGIDVVLVVTLVNTVNDHQVGPIMDFAVQNSDKISFIAFQPVSFTGRDENVSDEERFQKRYTTSHLAHDVKKHTNGFVQPLRDWFPLSAISVFADFTDMMKGAEAEWGTLHCGCHPDCGSTCVLFVNKETKKSYSLGYFFNLNRYMKDVITINDMRRGKTLSAIQMILALLRNYSPTNAPKELQFKDLLTKFDKQSGGSLGGEYGTGKDRKIDKWLFLFVGGMWFQDLWTYDFRRTERCSVPYGTQEGEISFCAYNTGIGWRNIVENKYKTASLTDWYKKMGRHNVYANHKPLDLPSFENTLKIPGKPDYDASQSAGEEYRELKKFAV